MAAGRPLSQRDRMLAALTGVQRQFILDPARYKLARCSRRSGKTFMDAAYLILECISSPGTPTLYAGLTRDSAKAAIWQTLIDLLLTCGIDYTPHASVLAISFPNGSSITLFGCDTENARNRLRGRKFKLVIFDETGFYASLDPLIYAILPTLADMQGTLVLTSSPGELLQGFFYEADQGRFKDKWSRYFWTIHDNPHFQKPASDPRFATKAEEELATVLEFQFHGKTEHPGYQREWLGQWVQDHTSLVYPAAALNIIAAPVRLAHQEHAIGICVTPFVYAAVVGRYSPESRDFQFIHSAEYQDYTVDDFAARLETLMTLYRADQVVAHTGDYSRHIVGELKRRYKMPIIAMDDRDTSFHQSVFANDLRAGYIKIVDKLPLIDRYAKIVKGPDGDEIAGQANFAPNAALALYRRIYVTTLQSVEPRLSDEERHIKQLEDARFTDPDEIENNAWYNRYD